jgi:hypothetical protein
MFGKTNAINHPFGNGWNPSYKNKNGDLENLGDANGIVLPTLLGFLS